MSEQIIKQPNGKYCVLSGNTDDFIFVDATRQEIINERVKEAIIDITDSVNNTCNKLDKGEKPYHQFTMSFKEAVKFVKKQHGKNCESVLYFEGEK